MISVKFKASPCKAYGWTYRMNYGKPCVAALACHTPSKVEHVEASRDGYPVRVRILLESDYRKLTKAARSANSMIDVTSLGGTKPTSGGTGDAA